MKKNLKKRVYTSVSLLLLLFLMLINNYILGYILIITGVFSIIEFLEMNAIIFKKKKIISILSNIIFIIYIFVFCSALLIFSNFVHLKIMIWRTEILLYSEKVFWKKKAATLTIVIISIR